MVPHIEAHFPGGEVKRVKKLDAAPGDFVLCRVTATPGVALPEGDQERGEGCRARS